MARRIVVLIVALLLSICSSAWAHSGRTDSQGGHYNHSTGEYHFHHGYPEHQHPDGVCPYATSAKVTAKPSKNNPYSNSAKSAQLALISKNTATPSPRQEGEIMGETLIIKLLSAASFVLLIALITSVRKVTSTAAKLRETSDELVALRSKFETIKTEANKVPLLEEKLTKFYGLSKKHYMENFILKSRISELEESNALICKSLHKSSIIAYWPSLTSSGGCRRISGGDPVVFVSKSNTFHKTIHGNWSNMKEMPLLDALKLGATPCDVCVRIHPSKPTNKSLL